MDYIVVPNVNITRTMPFIIKKESILLGYFTLMQKLLTLN